MFVFLHARKYASSANLVFDNHNLNDSLFEWQNHFVFYFERYFYMYIFLVVSFDISKISYQQFVLDSVIWLECLMKTTIQEFLN